MPSHNLTMAVTPGIPPAGNHCSCVQQTRQSQGPRLSKRGEAAPMCPARRRSRHHVCVHILHLRSCPNPGVPVLTHNPTMAVTRGIPPAGDHCALSLSGCLDKAVLAQGGGGGGITNHPCITATVPSLPSRSGFRLLQLQLFASNNNELAQSSHCTDLKKALLFFPANK